MRDTRQHRIDALIQFRRGTSGPSWLGELSEFIRSGGTFSDMLSKDIPARRPCGPVRRGILGNTIKKPAPDRRNYKSPPIQEGPLVPRRRLCRVHTGIHKVIHTTHSTDDGEQALEEGARLLLMASLSASARAHTKVFTKPLAWSLVPTCEPANVRGDIVSLSARACENHELCC